METQKEPKKHEPIKQEDMTPEQLEKWLAFYRMAMQRKRESLAEMREYMKTEEYQESSKRLKDRNAERGTPFV